jgi:hypothetical protein
VAHEHYHGVSNRSAAKGDTGCLGLGVVVQFPSEAGGQGEGWSDFIAESLTDDDITGEFVTGEFDRGIRTLPMNNFRWSYGAINRRGLNRRDFPAPPDVNPSIVSTNPTNYPAFQVHHVGTIFAPMLWDMRELLIMKQKVGSAFPGIFFDGMRRLGTGASFFIGERQVQSVDTQHPINYRESFGTHAVVMPTPNPNSTPPNPGTAPLVVPNVKPADIVRPGELANEIQTLGNRQGPLATAVSLGGRLADTLVLRGLQLSPCNPSIVDTRDAILMADLELTGGENRAVIWRAFASHGVGALASSTAGTGADQGVPPPGSAATTTAPAVVEDFSVPAGVTACEQMGPLPAPTFSLSNTINNTVTISITAAVGANKYIIRRSNSASGPFTLVGETTSTTFNDNDGGSGLNINQTYYYEVRASRDAESNCISTATVQSITVTLGVVIEPAPIFAGVNLISDPRDGSRLIVSWNPASSINPDAQIVYDVFRKNTVQQGDGTQRASFTPSQADLIATVSGTSYNDVGLELGNVYYYVVQARDLENGTKDTNNVGNTVTRFNAPTVPFFAANPPFPLEDFETSAASGRFTPPLSEEGNNPDQATPIFQRITGEAFGGIPSVGKMYAPEFSPGHEATGCNPNPGGTSCGGQADYSAMIGPVALTPTSIMEFDHSFNSEEFFDGGVIEISIGDPSFSGSTPFPNNVTVFDAGNFIIESAYKSPLDGVLEEPVKLSILQGRLAYSGSQSQQHVRVALNDFAPGGTYNPNNQQVYIRLRNTSDAASAVGLDAGWYIDNLVINNLACFVNIAASSSGATASASSTHVDRNYSPGGAIDGDRTGFDWENGGGWNDGTRGVWPDWLQVNFSGNQTITQINIYTLQNDFRNPIEPTSATPADLYGIEDFQVQYWNGSTWVVVDDPTTTGVVEGDIVGNNKAMRVILIPSGIPTDKIRVHVTKGRVHYSRIVEVEAFGCSP